MTTTHDRATDLLRETAERIAAGAAPSDLGLTLEYDEPLIINQSAHQHWFYDGDPSPYMRAYIDVSGRFPTLAVRWLVRPRYQDDDEGYYYAPGNSPHVDAPGAYGDVDMNNDIPEGDLNHVVQAALNRRYGLSVEDAS